MKRRQLSLRQRLILFYGLSALAPVGVAGYLLLTYLHRQIDHSLRQFQRGVHEQIESYNLTMEESTHAVTQESLKRTLPQLEHQLQADHAKVKAQQQQALLDTIHQFKGTLELELERLNQATDKGQQAMLSRLGEHTEQTQTRSLAHLTQQASELTHRALTELITTQMATLTNSLSRQVESVLRNYLAQLTLIAQQPSIQSAQEQESRWILQALQNREPAYQLLALLDAEGNFRLILSDEEPDRASLFKVATPLWESLSESEDPLIGSAQALTLGGGQALVIPIMVPIRQRGTQLIGAVFALIDLRELNALVRAFRLGKHGYAFLATYEGVILAHPNRALVGAKETAFVPSLSQREPFTQELDTPQGKMVVSSAPIPSLSACLVMVQPSAEAFQLVSGLQTQLEQTYALQRDQTQQAIAHMRQLASAELQQQLAERQSQIARSLEQAKQQTVQQANTAIEQLNQKQRAELTTLVRTTLGQIPQALRRDLQTLRAQAFRHISQQFVLITQQIGAHIQDQMLNAFVVVLIGVMGFLILGGVYLHRTLVRPLKCIISAAHEIAQGNLHKRVQLPYQGCPDLNDLANSFNHMVDSLRQAEAQLIQSSKLASLGTLASGVAHELNQPLAIIRAIAQQNLETLESSGGVLNPSQCELLREDLRIVERQTSRMSQIILHLRAFARKPNTEKVAVNLNEVAQNALVLLREQLRQRGIDLQEAYDPHLPPVMGDPNGLEQIVINLLTNARDALEQIPNAQLTLATRIQSLEGHTWVELHVQDNGPGIPPDIRSQIFDPFFTTKDPNKGTGLGLSISLEIAQKHGGRLVLEDSSQGAHFVLRLPAVSAGREAA